MEQRQRQSSGDITMEVKKQVLIERLKEDSKKFQAELAEQIDIRLSGLVKNFVNEVEETDGFHKSVFQSPVHTVADKLGNGKLKDKEFLPRNALLTYLLPQLPAVMPKSQFDSMNWVQLDLLEVSHIRSIQHIFIAILILFLMNTVVSDYLDHGKINLNFELIIWAFGQFHLVVEIWLGMQFATMALLYPVFIRWISYRATNKRLVDSIGLVLYVVYLSLFFYLPVHTIIENKLPPASSMLLLSEQVRLIMKSHAFVRSNCAKVLSYQPSKDDEKTASPHPDFSRFLYFLFAPTLVYRDHYPRTSHVRWSYVLSNFGQVLGCFFYTYFMFARYCVPVFNKFGLEPLSLKVLVVSIFGCMMPGTLLLLCGFFAVLHAWLNAFAEMLKFADRLFYKDWWNSTSFAVYYRTWNGVVHDWLYTYVYKDVYEITSNRAMAMVTVFTISALVHEYIATFTLKFFYPLLYVLFGGFGVMLQFVTAKGKSRTLNVFMWLALFMGTGLMMSLYSMEWYARVNCPPYDDTYLDYLIPRSWTCYHTNSQKITLDTTFKTEL